MRKRPAAVLLGMFVMVTGTYMAWCALPCLRPMFLYDDNVPEGARQAINEWRRTSPLLTPSPPKYFVQSLANPWEMKLDRRWVEVDALGRVRVKHFGSSGVYFEPDASGNWKGTIYSCSGPYPLN